MYTAPDGVLTAKKGKIKKGKLPKEPGKKKRKWWHIFG